MSIARTQPSHAPAGTPRFADAISRDHWKKTLESLRGTRSQAQDAGPPSMPQSPDDAKVYLKAHPHASAKTFDIPHKPKMGTVTAEYFIAAQQVRGHSPVGLRGNGRDFNPRFDPAKTKVTLNLDLKRGKGVMIVNDTHVDAHLGSLKKSWTASAQPIHVNKPDASDHDNEIGVRTRPDGKVEIKIHAADGLDEHIPNVPLPNGHSQDVAPEIDSNVVLSDKSGKVVAGDLFPSVGLYRWRGDQVRTLQQRPEHHPWGLVDGIGEIGQGDPLDKAVTQVKRWAGDVKHKVDNGEQKAKDIGKQLKRSWNTIIG